MLGVGLPWQWAERDTSYYTRTRELLGWPQWYSWKADCIGMDGYTPMVYAPRLGPQFSQHIARAQAWKQEYTVWILGNECEREEQANVSPAEFAEAIRTWLALVGGQWAGPGILWSDGGRAWLDAYLRAGGPIPDVWAIHIYGSGTPRSWMMQYEHLQAWLTTRRITRPIWITETNARADVAGNATLMRFLVTNPEIVAYWYSSHDPFGDNRIADLHDAAGLTELGQLFADLQRLASVGLMPRPRREQGVYFPFLPG